MGWMKFNFAKVLKDNLQKPKTKNNDIGNHEIGNDWFNEVYKKG